MRVNSFLTRFAVTIYTHIQSEYTRYSDRAVATRSDCECKRLDFWKFVLKALIDNIRGFELLWCRLEVSDVINAYSLL